MAVLATRNKLLTYYTSMTVPNETRVTDISWEFCEPKAIIILGSKKL